MPEIWKYGDDLITIAEGGDQWCNIFAVPKIMEKFQLIHNSLRTARHINFFNRHDMLSALLSAVSMLRGRPFPVFFLFKIPFILVSAIFEVNGFVYG